VRNYLSLATAASLTLLTALGTAANASTVLSISPSAQIVGSGSTFTVDVNISGVTDLYGYQFDLSFKPNVLSAVSSSEGSFLTEGGATFFVPGTNDNVGGVVSGTADTLIGAIPGVTGSGTLAMLTFRAIGTGTSALSIQNETLLDSNLNLISDTTTGGAVTVTAVPLPPSFALLVSGLAALLLTRLKRNRPGIS
jgi:hypothetical protein